MTIETGRAEGAQLACANAASWWSELARAREHALIQRRGYLWVPGSVRAGLRIMVLRPGLDPAEIDEITALAASWPAGSRLVVEDPYSVLDLTSIGLRPSRQPVMLREPAPITGTPRVPVSLVGTEDELGVAERTIVDAFRMTRFLPYRRGECLAAAMAQRPGLDFHLARRESGEPAGACASFFDGTVGGIYWVGTLPEHRSHGVGRAVMISALRHLGPDVPATLTATAAGQPLYESLGFRTVAESTWWWPGTA